MPTDGLTGQASGSAEGPAMETLSTTDCMALLGSRSFGRVCSCVDDGVVSVALTTYAVRGSALYFRAAAFGQVARRGRTRPVTLQVDDATDDRPPTWSVTVSGPVSRVTDAATLASLWSAPRTQPWEAGQTVQWLTLVTEVVQGRRVRDRSQV